MDISIRRVKKSLISELTPVAVVRTLLWMGGFRRSRNLRVATVAAALSILLQPVGAARADHGGIPFGSTACIDPAGKVPRNCVSVADSVAHYIYVSPLVTGDLRTALLNTMSQDYNPTDLTILTQTTINTHTDVEAYAADYNDNGVAGWVVCPLDAPQGINAKGDRWCKRQGLRFNLDPLFALYFSGIGSKNHITCHELGHTVGLQHWGGTTCMTVNTPDGAQNLHSTDIGHINAYYP